MQKDTQEFYKLLYRQSRVPDIVGIILIFLASWYFFATLLELVGVNYYLNEKYLIVFEYKAESAYRFSDNFMNNTAYVIGLGGMIWSFTIGSGLTQYKDWARKQLNYYVIFSLANALLLFVYTIKEFSSSIEMGTALSVALPIMALPLFAEPLVNFIFALFVNQPQSRNSLS
jgi:hypothetical protein